MPSLFIVGHGPGIATGVAQLFASKGFDIGLISRNPTAPTVASGVRVVTRSADARNPEEVVAALDALVAELDRPEVLLYNASGLFMGPKKMLDLTQQEMVDHLILGPVSGLVLGQWAARTLEGPKKTLLFTGGSLARRVVPVMAGLGAGKAGLLHVANNLHAELKPAGIHVCTLSVCGLVKDGDPKFSKELIAQAYEKIYEEGLEGESEVIYV